MPYMKILFVPTTVTHIGRFEDLMSAFQQRGDTVELFCMDSAMGENDRILDRIEAAGYPFRCLPEGVCNPNPHWSLVWLSRKRLVRALLSVWRDCDIDCLVIGSSFGFARQAIITSAVESGIPIVHILDGLVVPVKPRRIRILKRRKLSGVLPALFHWLGSGAKCHADLILLMNLTGREQLIRSGVPAERIKVVGSPAHDRLAASDIPPMSIEQRRLFIDRLGLPQGRPVVLFAAQETSEFDHRLVISHMMPAVRRSGVALLVKFHPRDPIVLREWREWAESEGFGPDQFSLCRDELSSIEALQLCEVCVTFFSTVSVEAMIVGKPVIYIQYLEGYSMPFASIYGAGIDAVSPEDLQAAIERLVGDDALRRKLAAKGYAAAREELAGLDGASLNRIIAEITLLAACRKGPVPEDGGLDASIFP